MMMISCSAKPNRLVWKKISKFTRKSLKRKKRIKIRIKKYDIKSSFYFDLESYNISILDDIFFAFLSGFLSQLFNSFITQISELLEPHDLSCNETFSEISMNNSCCILGSSF